MNIKNITVEVRYRVSLGDLEIPDNVAKQLEEMKEKQRTFDVFVDHSGKYSEAFDWVSENIKEGDCCDYLFEVEDFETE